MGFEIQGGVDVPVIGNVILALDGKHRHFEVRDQRSGHVILGGEWV
jgi:hypothetical protein